MKNQKRTQSINQRRLNRIRHNNYNIRRNNRKAWNLWFDNLGLWIAIFADLAGRLSRFLWRHRKLIISIVLVMSTILITGTFTVLTVFHIRIGIVEEVGYQYGWRAIDTSNYQRIQDLKQNFLDFNPIANWLSCMGTTAWGFILRALLSGGIVAISYKWFAALFCRKPKRRKRRAYR